MSIIETVADVDNAFLSRRELVCNFAGLAGKLKRLEAVEMITKEFKLDGKLVILMRLKTHVGKPVITGTFYVYEDETLAKKHVDPTIFARLERTKAAIAEAAKEDAPEADTPPKEAPADAPKEAEPADKPDGAPKDAKPADKPDGAPKDADTPPKEAPADAPKDAEPAADATKADESPAKTDDAEKK
ncbi:MAG: hypothetical protein EB830_06410 [Nitrosopumilus sp. H13]|nr:MAG: hypothetical protein EB830_06410 [Nitrosopumilus sp. H13]